MSDSTAEKAPLIWEDMSLFTFFPEGKDYMDQITHEFPLFEIPSRALVLYNRDLRPALENIWSHGIFLHEQYKDTLRTLRAELDSAPLGRAAWIAIAWTRAIAMSYCIQAGLKDRKSVPIRSVEGNTAIAEEIRWVAREILRDVTGWPDERLTDAMNGKKRKAEESEVPTPMTPNSTIEPTEVCLDDVHPVTRRIKE